MINLLNFVKFNKKIKIVLILLPAVIFVSCFFDKGLAVGLGLILVLSLAVFFILSKLGFKNKNLYVLFLTVVAMHLLITLFMHYANFQPFSGGTGDYIFYQHQARAIAERLSQGNFSLQGIALSHYYPVILGYIYALTLPEEIIGLMLNVWLVALSVIFVYLIVLEIGGSGKNAFLIGLIAAVYPSYVFNSGLLLKEAFQMCFVALGLLFLIKTIKKFTWYNFLILYLALIGSTHFRFYVGYALIGAFVLSWFLFADMNSKKRIICGILFIIVLGFIPQIAANQGYFGVNSFKMYLNSRMVTFFRQSAYNAAYYKIPILASSTSGKLTSVASTQLTISTASTPATDTSAVPNSTTPVSAVPFSTVGFGSSFHTGNGLLGYAKSFIYVLLGPFPWQIKSLNQSFALFETIPWYFILFFIVNGIIICFKQHVREVAPLLIFSIMVMAVITIFEGNFGIITRIRMPAFISLLCVASLSPIAIRFTNVLSQRILKIKSDRLLQNNG